MNDKLVSIDDMVTLVRNMGEAIQPYTPSGKGGLYDQFMSQKEISYQKENIEEINTKLKELTKRIEALKAAPDNITMDKLEWAADITQDILALELDMVNVLVGDAQLNRLRDIIKDLPEGYVSVERTDPEDIYSPFVIYTKGKVFTDSCSYDSAQSQLTCLKWGYLLSTKEGK